MDGLVEKLLRLESAKHKALIEIDASAYNANVRMQLRLLSVSKSADNTTSLNRLLALSQLITLNKHLLQNLPSPLFGFSKNGYPAEGRVAIPARSRRVSVGA
jgi:hypothetical protein